MNRLPPNYRQTTANVANRQTANRLYIKGGGGGGGGGSSTANEQTLPGLPDYREPKTCPLPELPQLLTQAAASGFQAIRLERLKGNYLVTFQALPTANKQRAEKPVQCVSACRRVALV